MKEQINNYLHKFSKAVAADGQNYSRQAQFRSGHNIDYVTVRGDDVPDCLVQSQLLDVTKTPRVVIPQYNKVLKFYDKVLLTEVPRSNGESYYLLVNGMIVSNFIDPSDKLIDGKSLSRGYTITIYGKKQDGQLQKISSAVYDFDTFSGILYFEKGKTPKDFGYTEIYIEAFQYIGRSVKQDFKNIDELIAINLLLMQKLSAERIVVQPYQFTTDNMETVWPTPKPIPGAFNQFGKQIWSQRFKINIPGYIFETSVIGYIDEQSIEGIEDKTIQARQFYKNSVVIPDMIHNADGTTTLEIELEVDAGEDGEDGTGKVITGFVKEENHLYMRLGKIQFSVSTFKRNDGQLLDIKDPIVFNNKGSELMTITKDLKDKLIIDKYEVDFSNYSTTSTTKQVVESRVIEVITK